jgi:hypothetical protein
MHDTLRMLFDTLTQHIHIPADRMWIPVAASVGGLLLGLALLIKGTKLIPAMAGLFFLVVGASAGALVATRFGTPWWLTVVLLGAAGFGLGLVLCKFWMAILLTACFSLGGLTLYTARVLWPHLETYAKGGVLGSDDLVTLQAAQEAAPSPAANLGELWGYLAANVTGFQTSFFAIILSTGLAGLVFGLLLPKIARALWAATAGAILFCLSSILLLEVAAPGVLAWLDRAGGWPWLAVALIWAASLAFNILAGADRAPKPLKKQAAQRADEPVLDEDAPKVSSSAAR